MIETFTIDPDSFFNEKKQDDTIMETLNQTEQDFYESIKPVLNTFVKSPSDEAISKILAFSRSV